MALNFVTNLGNCADIVAQMLNNNISLLYYSHIPTGIISLFIGFYVFFKNKKSLVSKILLSISIVFSLWLLSDLIVWLSNDTRKIMFFWSLLEIFDPLFYILCLYFVYVFIDKKDVSFMKKSVFGILLLPILYIVTTKIGLESFYIPDCTAIENDNFLNYIYFVEIIISVWIITLSVVRYLRASKEDRKQIIILATGILCFLLLFFFTGFLSGYLIDQGYITGYGYELYGLFGMIIFMGFLAYLIVKFKAFNIKMLAAQALVVSLIILIGSMFAFVETTTSRILVGVTLALSAGMGWLLVKSVKLEVQRKEELQYMSDKLAMANDQLRKLDNAKSEFISIASHQLRTPLTAIKGFVSLLLEGTYGSIKAPEREALNKIYLSCERLIQLVENLLNVSRIESGRIEYEFRKWRVRDIIKEISDSLIFAARNKGLYLHIDIPQEGLPEVEVDGAKIKEVISNLVDNAVKYTRRGGVTIKAEILNPEPEILNEFQVQKSGFHTTDYDSKVLRITVSDTGIGIPKEDLPYLFSKFSRGRDTNRLHVTGTGLGLYVGKSIVEAHHGRIWAESDGENKGSRFIVELPISQDKYQREERMKEFVSSI